MCCPHNLGRFNRCRIERFETVSFCRLRDTELCQAARSSGSSEICSQTGLPFPMER